MIVKNKEISIARANEIGKELLKLIGQECNKFEGENDPAEHIYLIVHTLAFTLARACKILEGYGEIYGIENMSMQIIYDWIDAIIKEYKNEL